MAQLPRDMQEQIGRFYAVELAHDVRDFLITDAVLLDSLTAGAPGRAIDEKLIVMEGDDGIDLALYLDAAVLARLAAADPRERLCGANLADFWTLLEGVSHFSYLVWNAAFDQPVSLLELEMQAEVDKYVSTRLLLEQQPDADLGGPLLQRLFIDTCPLPGLDDEERDRYHDASHLACRYCADLESRYPADRLTPGLVRELRSFYRLPQAAKVSRIRAAHFA
jgi:hypothetical protein